MAESILAFFGLVIAGGFTTVLTILFYKIGKAMITGESF
jgi:hypothetical protein